MKFKWIICSIAALELVAASVAFPLLGRRLETPKAQEQRVTSGSPMVKSFVVQTRTNRVTRLNFNWGYDPRELSNVDHFVLYLGVAPGIYTIAENAGTNLSYAFIRTNWSEGALRHFAVVVAIAKTTSDFANSDPSNEVHWPLFPPDHIALSWTQRWPSVTIFASTEVTIPLARWTPIATVTGTNYYSEPIDVAAATKFYCLNQPDRLSISLFNPNP